MISSSPCRKLMMKLANNGNLTDHQFKELVQHLSKLCPSVVPFINWVNDTYDTFSHCPSSIKALIRAIAASSPVCGLIRPTEELHALFRDLIIGENVFGCPAKVKLLHEQCPVIFAVLRELSHAVLPEMWRPMFAELLNKSRAPFSHTTAPCSAPIENTETDALCCFPTLPKRRNRKFYLADAARRKEEICTKKHPGHSFFLPGIFTLFCPHGILFLYTE